MERLQIGIRDFIVAHYKLTQRDDTPFWRHVAAMPIPDSLAERIDLFERRGEVLAEHGDLFKEANWFAVLDGMGVRACSWHLAADLPSLEELRGRMDQIASLVAKRAQSTPARVACNLPRFGRAGPALNGRWLIHILTFEPNRGL